MECSHMHRPHRRHLRKASGYRDPTRKRYMVLGRINASVLRWSALRDAQKMTVLLWLLLWAWGSRTQKESLPWPRA